MPVTVKEVINSGTSEDHPDCVLHGTHSIVLNRLVLTIQSDRDLWDAILVDDLPDVPVFFPRCFPEPEGCDKGVLIRQTLGKDILSSLHHREGTHPHIGTLGSVFSLPQDFLHAEQIHQIETCDFLASSIGVFKAVSFYPNTRAENVFAKPTPQLATDLVDGVEVGNVENMRRLGF